MPNRSHKKTYASWQAMRKRCNSTWHPAYHRYGGRGIAICERWNFFQNFLEDMGERPEGMSLDRINPNKGYEPGNCRWATWKEQNNNKRNNRVIEFRGERKTLTEWAAEVGLMAATINQRLKRGWPVDRALTEPAASKFSPPNGAPFVDLNCSGCGTTFRKRKKEFESSTRKGHRQCCSLACAAKIGNSK